MNEQTGTVTCDQCGATHEATYSHVSQYGGHDVWAVVCSVDYLTDYYLRERVRFA